MAIVRDWMQDVIDAIPDTPDGSLTVARIRAAIVAHCPFQPGIAYMPVPRCETCLHWDNIGQTNKFHGFCRLGDHDPFSIVDFRGMTPYDFGCVKHKERT